MNDVIDFTQAKKDREEAIKLAKARKEAFEGPEDVVDKITRYLEEDIAVIEGLVHDQSVLAVQIIQLQEAMAEQSATLTTLLATLIKKEVVTGKELEVMYRTEILPQLQAMSDQILENSPDKSPEPPSGQSE